MIDQKNCSSILLEKERRRRKREKEGKKRKRKRIVQVNPITSQTRMQITDSTIDGRVTSYYWPVSSESHAWQGRGARTHTHTHTHTHTWPGVGSSEGGRGDRYRTFRNVTATRNEGGRNTTTRAERTTGGRRQSGLSVIHALMIGAIVMSTSDPRGPFDSLVAAVPRETTGFH